MDSAFTPLDALKHSAFRIFDPFAYKYVHECRFVPVGLQEATTLARFYPIVWIPDLIGDLQAVVILRMHQGGGRQAPPPGMGLGALPNLLQAYPFRVRDLASHEHEVGLEKILPEQERDGGSYVFDSKGEPSAGARLKLSALERFLDGREVLQELSNRLQIYNFLEPVRIPTQYQITPPLPDMFAALEDIDLGMLFKGLPPHYIPKATAFLVAQRMSLYRMHRLLKAIEGEHV